MAFYGIGNLFGPIPKPETREKEKNRESEDKKKAEQASNKEEVAQEKQVQVQEQATQAEAQRQRLLQLQEKVARKLEDFVRASGREHAEGTEGDAEGLMQQLGNEGDSFTPENLQRLRQLSQNANSAMRAAREGRGEARADEGSRRPETDLPKPQVTSAQDLELQMRRASQELKNQQKQLDEQATGRTQQQARETGRDTASDTRSQKAQEGPQARQAAGEGTAARPQAEQSGAKGDLLGAKPQADARQPQGAKAGGQEPPRAELPPRQEGAKTEQPKAELPKPELPKPELPKAELPKAELPKPELPKPELPKAELPKPEGREGAETARGHEPETPPPPPRPDAMRARPEAPTSRAPEAKPEAKGSEGKPQAEGQEPAAQPRLGTTPRFGTAVRPEAGAPRPGETTADRPQGTRPEAGRQSTTETGAQTGSRQSPAPEGPRNARGQETVGGAAVTTGGTPNEKAQARLGDMRLAPHLEAQKPGAAKPQTPQGGKEQAGKAGADQDQAGKPAPGGKGQGSWNSMGLGGIRPGLTPPLFQRPGLGNQAPGQSPQLGNQAPGAGQPTRPGAGQPAGPGAETGRPGVPPGGAQGPGRTPAGPVFTPGFGMPKPANPDKPSGPVFTPGFGMPKSETPEKPGTPGSTPGSGAPKSADPQKPSGPIFAPGFGMPKSADPQKPSGPTFTPGFGMPKSADPQKPGSAAPQAPEASPGKEPPAEAGPGWRSIPAVGGGGFRPPAISKPAAPAAGAPAGQAPGAPPKSEPTDSAPGWRGIPSVGGGFRAPQFSRPSFPGGGAPDLAPDPDAPMPEPPRATPRPGGPQGPQAPGALPKAGAPAAKPPETAPKEGGAKKDPEGKAPAESGPGWKAIPTVGSGYRPPVAPQYPPGQQGPGGPQGPQGPDSGRPQLGRPPVEGEPAATPGAAPTMPRSGHLGPIRIPPPDGGKDPGARDDESHDVELGDGSDFDPGWRPNRPGSATPVPIVRGPRHERGPVEEVDPRLSDARKESPQEGTGWKRLPGIGPGSGFGRAYPEGKQAPGGPPPGVPGLPGTVADGRSRSGAPLLGGPTTPGGAVPGDIPDGFEHAPGHVNFDLLRRSPFRAAIEGVPDEGQAPGPAGPGGATGRSPGQWQGVPGVGALSGGAGAYRATPPQTGGPQAGGPDVPGKALGDAPTPRVEFLRPRASAPQPSLLTDSILHPQGPDAAGPRPGAPLPTAQAAEAAERARVAAQILSGDSQYLGSSAGPVGRLLDPALPGEFRATLTSPTSSRLDPNSPLRAAVPRGPMTGGRPVTAHVPVYQPMLDLIYMIRGKGKVDQESTPIKMTLSGMVGSMDRESYTPRTAPPAQENPRMQPGQRPVDSQNQSSAREQITTSQRQVFDASEQAPLLGTMSASMRGPGESTRPERATSSTKQQESQGKVDTGAQVVAEIGDAPGRGRGGSTGGDGGGHHRGSEGSAGAHGEKGAPGAPAAGQATPEQQQRMQSLRLAATHEAFRISMEKLDRQMNQRRYEVAIRNASTSIESILKRVYRRQDLEDLDENEAVNSLVMMLKLGGEFTYAHSARVLDFAMDLADEMGVTDEQTRRQIELGALLKDIGEVGVLMSQEEDDKIEKIADFMSTQDMRQAGLLHDIGKLRIPRDILYKPGRMTDEEYTLMKMHPIYGEQMVYPIASLRHLCPTIRGHHERWDGKGYPDGLRGDRIPLPARILAVADVFDALHAERPYKAGMEVSQARQILEEGKGTHFDPDCVDAFLRVLDRRFPQATRRRSHRAKILESVDA